jgi:hypothetical protein
MSFFLFLNILQNGNNFVFSELVKDYRKLSKQAREKDHNIREEIQKTTERGAARGR